MFQLYGMSSPNVIKILLALEEMGLRYRTHHVGVFRGDQFESEFLELNPLGKVPVLVDGETVIFESGAILIYLAETYGGLLPERGAERYEVMKWLMVQVANVGPLLGQLNHFLIMPESGNEYALQRYRDQAARIYRVLDDRLAASEWLGGGAYSIADVATWPWARYLPKHGLSWSDHPALHRWWEKIGERPAAARALEAVGGFVQGDVAAGAEATPEQVDRFFGRREPGPAPDFSRLAG